MPYVENDTSEPTTYTDSGPGGDGGGAGCDATKLKPKRNGQVTPLTRDDPQEWDPDIPYNYMVCFCNSDGTQKRAISERIKHKEAIVTLKNDGQGDYVRVCYPYELVERAMRELGHNMDDFARAAAAGAQPHEKGRGNEE